MATSILQLQSCLQRVAIEKKRNFRVTCCECCSHLIIIFILVIGYGLSIVENFNASKYTDIDIRIPPDFIFSSSSSTEAQSAALDLYNSIVTGPLIIPSFDQYIMINEYLSENVESVGLLGSVLSETSLGRSYTNLFYKGALHFAPRGKEVNSLIKYLNNTYTTFSSVDVFIHDTEIDGVHYILDHIDDPALALIVLREISPERVNFVIRQNYTTLPNTNLIVVATNVGLNMDYLDYIFSGFLTLERSVNEWIFEYTDATRSANPSAPAECTGPPSIVLIPFPVAAYDQNPFYTQVGFLLGLAIVMSTMYPMSRLTKSVVEEKELKMREVMKIMGLREWVHQLSWFLSAFVLFFWIALSCTFISKVSFLVKTSPGLLFAYYFLFCMSEINFAFLVSVFFSNSKLAAIVAPVVLFCAMLPRFAFLNTNNNELVVGKTLSSLLSPSAFAYGADIIADYEYSGVGVQFSNASDGAFSFNTVLFMMWADFFIYGFLAWYLDHVIPHEYGTAEHPLFFLSWRYWCPKTGGRSDSEGQQGAEVSTAVANMPEFFDDSSILNVSQSSAEEIGGESGVVDGGDDAPMGGAPSLLPPDGYLVLPTRAREAGTGTGTAPHGDEDVEAGSVLPAGVGRRGSGEVVLYNSNIEPIAAELRPLGQVRIRNLRKRYPDGNLAVRDFSLTMLEGQITCLLGHNGAGKRRCFVVYRGL
jgi:hypothetical protein